MGVFFGNFSASGNTEMKSAWTCKISYAKSLHIRIPKVSSDF